MSLDFLKSEIAMIEISLDRKEFQPGDAVHVWITVQSEKGVKVGSGKIALFCSEKDLVQRTTGSGKNRHTSTTWVDHISEVASEDFLGEIEIGPNFYQTYNFNWQLPMDLLPSLEGTIIKINWMVKASLERKMAVDVHSESSILVSIPMPGEITAQADGFAREVARCHLDDVDLSILLPRTNWAAGESIQGRLVIQALKDFKLTDIRLELVQTEDVPDYDGNEFESKVKIDLAGSTNMTAGQTLSLPFQIGVPSYALPTISSPHGKVRWELDGILARRLAKDYHIVQPLCIFGKG